MISPLLTNCPFNQSISPQLFCLNREQEQHVLLQGRSIPQPVLVFVARTIPIRKYPTPSHQNNFFPSQQQLPALPGLSQLAPARMHHHHGFVSHCSNTSPPASFINGNSLQPALRSDGNGSLSGKTNLLGSYTTPSSTQQESSLFTQVLLPPSGSTRKSSPCFSPPPPLPQVLALAVSPNDPTRQEDSTSAIVY